MTSQEPLILVTVGTEKFPFNRLMRWIDQLIEKNLIQPNQEKIVIQYGSCTLKPQKTNNFSVLPSEEFKNIFAQARLIIAHCGEGTIDLLANSDKPFVLVPRSGEYQEHVDDHQIELAEELSKQGVAIANCFKDLADFIANPKLTPITHSPTQYYIQASSLLEEQFENESFLEDLSVKF